MVAALLTVLMCAQAQSNVWEVQGKRSEAERAAVKARLDEISESRRPGREKLAIAEKLFLEGKFKAAKTNCDAAAVILDATGERADFDARLLRAEINLEEGNYPAAISEYNDLIAYNRGNSRITMGLAIAYANRKQAFVRPDLVESYAFWTKYLITKEPYLQFVPTKRSNSYKARIAEALMLRGIGFSRDTNLKRSLLDLREAHRLEPDSALISLMYGFSLRRSGEKQAALHQAKLASAGPKVIADAAKALVSQISRDP